MGIVRNSLSGLQLHRSAQSEAAAQQVAGLDAHEVGNLTLEAMRWMETLVGQVARRDVVEVDFLSSFKMQVETGAFLTAHLKASQWIAYSAVKRGTNVIETAIAYLFWVCSDRIKNVEPGTDTSFDEGLLNALWPFAEPFIEQFNIDHLILDCDECLQRQEDGRSAV